MRRGARYHSLRLPRHPERIAHIRAEDLAVIFAPSGGRAVEDLFAVQAATLALRQPRPRPAAGKRTFTCYMVLTDSCNLRCEYCDVLGRGDQRVVGTKMTPETARRALEILFARLAAEPDLQAQVVFFGGEPLMAWQLLTGICEQLDAHHERRRVAKMLVTNGTLIDADRAAFLLRHHVYVVVSVDGGPGSNDRVRVAARGDGSFGAVERGLDELRAVMPGQFGISCTVGSHNAATLAEEIRFLHRRFEPLCIGINIYHYQRDGTSPIDLQEGALCDALLEAFREARRSGIAIYQFIGILKAIAGRRRNLDYCPACVDKLLFTPRGRVGRCETLMADERFTVPIDEVVDGTLPPALDWTRYTPEHEPACQDCATRWICPGSCAYDQLVTTGSLCGVDPRRCNFHTRLLQEMLSLLLESCLSSGEYVAEPDEGIIVPGQRAFDAVVGGMPTTFPPNTIWIVSLAGVEAEEGGRGD